MVQVEDSMKKCDVRVHISRDLGVGRSQQQPGQMLRNKDRYQTPIFTKSTTSHT